MLAAYVRKSPSVFTHLAQESSQRGDFDYLDARRALRRSGKDIELAMSIAWSDAVADFWCTRRIIKGAVDSKPELTIFP